MTPDEFTFLRSLLRFIVMMLVLIYGVLLLVDITPPQEQITRTIPASQLHLIE